MAHNHAHNLSTVTTTTSCYPYWNHWHIHCHHYNRCHCGFCWGCGQYVYSNLYIHQPWHWQQPAKVTITYTHPSNSASAINKLAG